jgi:hypothetical protein
MKYEKPEIVDLASAIEAVQNIGKDGVSLDTELSDPTYQSDE